MKASSQREKWAAAILGVVAVALLINLLRSPFVRAGAPRPPSAPTSRLPGGRGTPAVSDLGELSRYDPEVRLDLLKELDTRPLPEVERDPFQYGLTPAEKAQKEQNAAQANQPPAPAPPPPIAVKALGYADGPGGVRQAFFTDEEETYQAREGESFAAHYKLLKITPMAATVEDQTSHVTAQLPFPE